MSGGSHGTYQNLVHCSAGKLYERCSEDLVVAGCVPIILCRGGGLYTPAMSLSCSYNNFLEAIAISVGGRHSPNQSPVEPWGQTTSLAAIAISS